MDDKSLVHEAKRMLGSTDDSQRFVLRDGSSLGNIHELYDSLKSMGSEVFQHHVVEPKMFSTYLPLAKETQSSLHQETLHLCIGRESQNVEYELPSVSLSASSYLAPMQQTH